MRKLPWRERRDKYLEHLRTASEDALLVSAADKLHNVRAILSDYRELGEQLWTRLKAGKEDQFWYYGELVEVLETAAPKRVVEELRRVVDELKALAE
jgi:hypothetical protein